VSVASEPATIRGMDDKPTKRDSGTAVVLTLFAVPMLLSALYVGGYFILSETVEGGSARFYNYRWLAEIYRPAAVVESSVTGRDVITLYVPDMKT
jgi:hypothetical protein